MKYPLNFSTGICVDSLLVPSPTPSKRAFTRKYWKDSRENLDKVRDYHSRWRGSGNTL